jgi:hypothetical protein
VDVKGVPMLVDPGVLSYDAANPLTAYGKSTPAHNTVNFNGWNQAPVKHFNTQYTGAPGRDFISNTYEAGYFPGRFDWSFRDGLHNGIWAAHERLMLWVHGRYIVVVDNVRYCPGEFEPPFVECNWQFERGPIEINAERREVLARHESASGEPVGLLLRVLSQPSETSLHLREGQNDPLRGWIISENGGIIAAPQVSLRCERLTTGAAQFVTLLVPFVGKTPPAIQAEVVADSKGAALRIEGEASHDHVSLDNLCQAA